MMSDRCLIKRFCKHPQSKYLDRMSPNVIQYFNSIIETNEVSNKVAKYLKKYLKKRVLRELKMIEDSPEDVLISILPNTLPIVLEHILKSMIPPYTINQLIVYNYCKNIGTPDLPTSGQAQPSDLPSDLPSTCKLNGLKYNLNSCYMDSVLLALFAVPNRTISDSILNKDLNDLKVGRLWTKCDDDLDKDIRGRKKIQRGLNDVTNYMRGLSDSPSDCKQLRLLLKNCIQTQAFHGTGTQDAGEFLVYLFNMFQVNVATTVTEVYGSSSEFSDWVLTSDNRETNDSVIVDVVSTVLMEKEANYDITKYVENTSEHSVEGWRPDRSRPEETFIRKRDIFRVESAPLVIFKLDRTYGSPSIKDGEYKIKTKNIWKKVMAPEFMMLNNIKLYLSAIVVHTGDAHYVVNVKCDNNWFFYDDTTPSVKHVGSYGKMLKTKPDPMTHGTIYMYT